MQLLYSDVKNDVKKVYLERLCRDMNSLLSYDIQNRFRERPPPLIDYLKNFAALAIHKNLCTYQRN